MSRVISGDEIVKILQEAGIIPAHCSRFVIDIDRDRVVRLYSECYGDERLGEIFQRAEIKKLLIPPQTSIEKLEAEDTP